MFARASFAELPDPDILLVPGGHDHRDARSASSDRRLDRAHPTTTWTTSVCTGALLLAGAGVLEGVDATTHWAARDDLARLGANPVRERMVRRGKVITAAGVSAGIDMALALAAEIEDPEFAKTLQLIMEYDPQPPFDAGSPAKAGPELVGAAFTAMAGVMQQLQSA